jgi:hypothetical protein
MPQLFPRTNPTDEEILELLKRAFQKRIPSGRDIATRAVSAGLADHATDVEWIKANFSNLVELVQIDAYEEYLKAERVAGRETLEEVFLPLLHANTSAEDAVRVVSERFFSLDRFYLALTQGRRPRAGKAFELVIRELFIRLGYPFTPQAVINGQPDFVLPSIEHFRVNAPDCIIFTVKRTLRERWRQIVTEGTRGLGFFLATIDEKVGGRDLGEMLNSRINLVVPDRIKQQCYSTIPNVVSFEYFFRFHLDPAMERWRDAGLLA